MGTINWTKDQQQIIDMRGCNILVSAAAGSGKTAVLVERIFKRITDKKDGVREMKKMSDDEVWEALYGDD